jgi:L-fuculose-phosphate aldolase
MPNQTTVDELKRDLVRACGILALAGQDDSGLGHVSGRLPGCDRFWMKPSGLGLAEVAEDDLILVDFDGQTLEGERRRHGEFPIHAEIMRVRPDVLSVVHTHPLHATALAATGTQFAQLSQDSMLFHRGAPVFDGFRTLVDTPAKGVEIAAALGDARALFLQNHGVVVAGASVAEACAGVLILERACQLQVLAAAGGPGTFRQVPPDEATEAGSHRERGLQSYFDAWVRRLP